MALKIQYRDHIHPITAELRPVMDYGQPEASVFCDLCGDPIEEPFFVLFTSPGGPAHPALEEVAHTRHLTEAVGEIAFVTFA